MNFKPSDAYFSLLIMGLDGLNTPAQEKKDDSQIDDKVEFEFEAIACTTTNMEIDEEDLSSPKKDGFSTENTPNIIVPVSREASKHLAKVLLIFLHPSSLNAIDRGIKLSASSKR